MMILDRQQKKIIKELSYKYSLPEEKIIEIVYSPFKFIRETCKKINLNGNETEEEFLNKTKNFNIPSIGKLHASYYNFKKINKIK